MFGQQPSSGGGLFGGPKPADAPGSGGLFGSQKTAPMQAPATSLFGGAKPAEDEAKEVPKPAGSMFGAQGSQPAQGLSMGATKALAPTQAPSSGAGPFGSNKLSSISPPANPINFASSSPFGANTTAQAQPKPQQALASSGLFASQPKTAAPFGQTTPPKTFEPQPAPTKAPMGMTNYSSMGGFQKPASSGLFSGSQAPSQPAMAQPAMAQPSKPSGMFGGGMNSKPTMSQMSAGSVDPSKVSLASMKAKGGFGGAAIQKPSSAFGQPQKVQQPVARQESCLVPPLDGQKLRAVPSVVDQIAALLKSIETGSGKAPARSAEQQRLDEDLKPLAQAMRRIYYRPHHDGTNVMPSIFSAQNSAFSDELHQTYYYAEIARQSQEILAVFESQDAPWTANLAPIAGVVEFFNSCFLSNDTLEAVRKLIRQNHAITKLQEVHDQTVAAMHSKDNQKFGTGLIRLMACGQFQHVIEAIKSHSNYSAQDNYCMKVIDEIDAVDRILTRSEGGTTGSMLQQQFVQEQRARQMTMKALVESQQARGQQGQFLDTLITLFSGEDRDVLAASCGSYQAIAALRLLFCPNQGQPMVAKSAEPTFVTTIRDAIDSVPKKQKNQISPLLLSLYKESSFTVLEKLLSLTAYGDSLMIFVFHLSHLLLRKLLYPDQSQSFYVFRRLFIYQTNKLLETCAHLMDFKDWLCYIDAIEEKDEEKAICLLKLIQSQLDLQTAADYRTAEAAINKLLKDDENAMNDESEEAERRVWLESAHSRSYLLLKLQKAFCQRQFDQLPASQQSATLDEALKVLDQMDKGSGYPQLIGFQLANALLKAPDTQSLSKAIKRCVSIYKSAGKDNLQAKLCLICTEFKIALKIAELATQVDSAQQSLSAQTSVFVTLPALHDLVDFEMPAAFWRPIVFIMGPVLPLLKIDSQTLSALSQKLAVAEIYFDDDKEDGAADQVNLREVFQVIGQSVHLSATPTSV